MVELLVLFCLWDCRCRRGGRLARHAVRCGEDGLFSSGGEACQSRDKLGINRVRRQAGGLDGV